ncbi:MAG: exodeoxyribonuclease VII small subunit [Bryobacterales bacterium]|nr:exodeoxyribonuclease VII small subunit [Bryobacterales bacterium]
MPEGTTTSGGFEEALSELEEIVKKLEAGDLKLEQTLQLFERGIQLRDRCQKDLSNAETRIETLVRRGSGVQPIPFEDNDNR